MEPGLRHLQVTLDSPGTQTGPADAGSCRRAPVRNLNCDPLMATKAHEFKVESERASSKKTSRRPRSKAGSGRAKDRYPNPASHNESSRAAKNGTYELEPAQSPRPSRKSTRRSPTHIKTDSALRIRAMNRQASPEARSPAGRGGRS